MSYYLIELDYYGRVEVVLSKCQCADVNNCTNRVNVDDYGFTLVDSENFSFIDEPFFFFFFASQVQQVSYVEDPKKNRGKW